MSQGTPPQAPFDLSAVFEVDDYMYFYRDDLTTASRCLPTRAGW